MSAPKIATPIRDGWWLITSTRTYRLSEPVPLPAPPGEARYVVVSTNAAEWESLAIACDEHGEPFRRDGNYLSLASVRSTDPDDAIRAMGFEVGPPEWEPEPAVEPLTAEQIAEQGAEIARQVAAYNAELLKMGKEMKAAVERLRALREAAKRRSDTMKKLRLFLYSLAGWPLGMAVESILLTCWPLFLYLWLGLGWRWYAALPALLIGWVGANLIGLATVRRTGWAESPHAQTHPGVSYCKTGGCAPVPVYHFAPWLWLYDNAEDGVNGPPVGRNGNERRWCERVRNYPLWLRILSWQFRNPIANLRLSRWGVHLADARIEAVGNCRRPDRIEWTSDRLHSLPIESPERDFIIGRARQWLWARKGWRVGFWMVRPSRKWRTITHAIGWRVFAFDPALDKPEDQHQPFKVQLWRRG